MTEEEYQKLLKKYGEPMVKRMVEVLDNYKGSKGKTYKDDYRAILNWVVGRVEEEFSRTGGNYHDNSGQSADDWKNFQPSTGFKGWGNETLSEQQDGMPDQQSYEELLTNM